MMDTCWFIVHLLFRRPTKLKKQKLVCLRTFCLIRYILQRCVNVRKLALSEHVLVFSTLNTNVLSVICGLSIDISTVTSCLSRDSSVGIVTSLPVGRSMNRSIPGRSKRIFCVPEGQARLYDPLSLVFSGYGSLFFWGGGGLFCRVQAPGAGSADVKNAWRHTFSSSCAFVGCTGTGLEHLYVECAVKTVMFRRNLAT
jgi:hypothetical protein